MICCDKTENCKLEELSKMALIKLIDEKIVKIPLTSQYKPEVIRELVNILMDAKTIDSADEVLEAIRKREEKSSTGLEDGIAVPHAKTNKVKTLAMAIGISPRGIDFDSMDGKPSQLFFMLLAPLDQSGPHLEALAEIAKLARSRTFCQTLINAKSAREVVNIFNEEL
jgi:fructose-specific phosphotransferase system IIA component